MKRRAEKNSGSTTGKTEVSKPKRVRNKSPKPKAEDNASEQSALASTSSTSCETKVPVSKGPKCVKSSFTKHQTETIISKQEVSPKVSPKTCSRKAKRKVAASKEVLPETATTTNDVRNVSQYSVESPQTDGTKHPDMKQTKLTVSDYDQPCTDLARYLLGKKLVRLTETGNRLSGMIVETEAYLGGEDKASHSYNGKRTARTAAMFMPPGTAYVYNIYGVYACINISSRGDGAAVLIRSLEVAEGEETIRCHRGVKRADHGRGFKPHELCNGPSKLTMALGLTKANSDQVDLCDCSHLWIEDGGHIEPAAIVATSRVGIENYAEEWAKKPLRFYIRGNRSVSVRDKQAEANT